MTFDDPDPPQVTTYANGLRLVLWPQPHGHTAAVSVFIATGSADERRALNGISHVVEHMVFKGSATRDAQQINLEAERLGADLNAHTDKDHTAYHLRGLGAHAAAFVPMLADLVRQPLFPEAELAREREVLLQELVEEEDDGLASAYRLFDAACWGLHPVARPVMGSRASLQRLGRDDLVRYVAERYTAERMVVTAAGRIDAAAVAAAVGAAFGTLPGSAVPVVGRAARSADTAPRYGGGGVRSRHMAGSSQAHLVMGAACAPRGEGDVLPELAATVLGEGMSSPLLAELRERRGLAYYAACAADVLQPCGQFVVEASVAPEALEEAAGVMADLLRRQAAGVDPAELERARHQLAVRWLRQLEKPARRMEEAALDLLALGRVRSLAERWAQVAAVTPQQLSAQFAALLDAGLTVAVAGGLGRGVSQRLEAALGGLARA